MNIKYAVCIILSLWCGIIFAAPVIPALPDARTDWIYSGKAPNDGQTEIQIPTKSGDPLKKITPKQTEKKCMQKCAPETMILEKNGK